MNEILPITHLSISPEKLGEGERNNEKIVVDGDIIPIFIYLFYLYLLSL